MRNIKTAILVGLMSLGAQQGLAKEEKRQLDAHVHGHGKLNIALEGNKLAMELEIPAWDIVGFGHEPSTDKQKEAMKAAKKSLQEDTLSLFEPSKEADCKLASSKVGHKHEDEHKDDHKEHKDEHKDAKKHEEHKDEHKEHKEGEKEGEHSEFHAKYELLCASPSKLTGINFAFFKRFANAKELEVTVIGKKGVKKFEVTRQKPSIKGLQ